MASSAETRSSGVSPIPTRIPVVNGILSSPASRIVSSLFAGLLGRRALMNDEVRVDRLEHQALRRSHLPEAGQILPRQDAEVRVWQKATLEAALAGPDDVRGEVVVPPLGEPPGDLGIDLGALAGEDQELLGVPADRVVEHALDLIRLVDVRPMGREGAVLAVALARPRQRERVVARERHPAHGRENLAKWTYVPGVVRSRRCRPGASSAGGRRCHLGRRTAAVAVPRRPAGPVRAEPPCPPSPAPGRWRAR